MKRTREEMTDNEREEIRKRIKGNARNLCELVVKTTGNYKEELNILEKELKKSKMTSKYYINQTEHLKEQNCMLRQELESEKLNKNVLQCKIDEFINNKSQPKCYNCFHSLDCKDASWCLYCHNIICSCCTIWCKVDKCYKVHCKSCDEYNDNCPKHNPDIDDEYRKELLEWHGKNNYKFPWDDDSEE